MKFKDGWERPMYWTSDTAFKPDILFLLVWKRIGIYCYQDKLEHICSVVTALALGHRGGAFTIPESCLLRTRIFSPRRSRLVRNTCGFGSYLVGRKGDEIDPVISRLQARRVAESYVLRRDIGVNTAQRPWPSLSPATPFTAAFVCMRPHSAFLNRQNTSNATSRSIYLGKQNGL